MDNNSIRKIEGYNASSIPILFELCRIAKIAETVNNMVTWRPENSKISPGFLIETLIVSIIHGRKPLWKLEEYWVKLHPLHNSIQQSYFAPYRTLPAWHGQTFLLLRTG